MREAADHRRIVALTTRDSISPLDVGVAAALTAAATAGSVARRLAALAEPVAVTLVLRPRLLPEPYQPERLLERLARRGRRQRLDLRRQVGALLDRIVPAVTEEVVRRLDLTAIVERFVDLDALVGDVDLNAAVAHVDLDAIADRLDVTAVVDKLDLTELVRDHVDLDSLVASVDLDAVVQRLDLDAIVARMDLAAIAEDVISKVDLPEIIRESTSAVSSETIREVRMRGISGDDAVGRAVDRLLRRRRSALPAPLPSSSSAPLPAANGGGLPPPAMDGASSPSTGVAGDDATRPR